MDTLQLKNRNTVLLIGIGIIGFLAIISFAFIFKQIVKEAFFHLSINSIFTVWTIEFVRLGICIGGILLMIKIVTTSSKSDIVLFRNVSILLLAGQILQAPLPFIHTIFRNENYLIVINNYREVVNENYFYMGLPDLFGILEYLIVVLIFFLKRKTTVANKS